VNYRRIAPGPEAARFVSHYWTLDGEGGAVQRVVPDGSPELIVNLGQPFESQDGTGNWCAQPRYFIAGQIVGPLRLRPAGAVNIIGVTFRPHGLAALLGIPAHEITGRIATLDDLNLKQLIDLPRRATIAQLEPQLLRRARPPADTVVGEAVRQIAHSHGTRDVASLARDFGISTRHLERQFLDGVGLPPKLYARMRRFQRVFPTIEEGSGSWAAAAAACGYYDQAHLIRDFREFAGQPPASLLASDDLARHFLSHFSNTGVRRVR
jgi:AraC-like DNA-binding protein